MKRRDAECDRPRLQSRRTDVPERLQHARSISQTIVSSCEVDRPREGGIALRAVSMHDTHGLDTNKAVGRRYMMRTNAQHSLNVSWSILLSLGEHRRACRVCREISSAVILGGASEWTPLARRDIPLGHIDWTPDFDARRGHGCWHAECDASTRFDGYGKKGAQYRWNRASLTRVSLTLRRRSAASRSVSLVSA